MRICPKCRSENVSADLSAFSYGKGSIFNAYICNECGFSGELFPEKVKKE